ncbi:hypothetical protein D3H55_17930 [Bacillus salacetis]|uniref:Uncharacterized protein n=1 Tax=Bacillus salacetis TaxID=2315464 RepID=A0A3A1QRR8_9BACI|nr:hypothetical protein D3H55_17930 [Bacillus salacetis]
MLVGLFDPEGLGAGARLIKSGSALISPDRQMFRREKKAPFPFILFGLFDPEGLGAGAGLVKCKKDLNTGPLK